MSESVYRMVSTTDEDRFNQQASELVAQGYEPAGGVCVTLITYGDQGYTGREYLYSQAFWQRPGMSIKQYIGLRNR